MTGPPYMLLSALVNVKNSSQLKKKFKRQQYYRRLICLVKKDRGSKTREILVETVIQWK